MWKCHQCAFGKVETPSGPDARCEGCGAWPSTDVLILAALTTLNRRLAEPAAPVVSHVSVEEAMQRIGCGRTKLWELVRAEKLEAVRQGKRQRISVASIEKLLAADARPLPLRQPKASPIAPGGKARKPGVGAKWKAELLAMKI